MVRGCARALRSGVEPLEAGVASTEPWISPGSVLVRVELPLANSRSLPGKGTGVVACRPSAMAGELAPLERLARSQAPAWHARAAGWS
jgi:hypothetical protein